MAAMGWRAKPALICPGVPRMTLEISPQDLKCRGGLLDQILEEAFDGAIILDAQGIVLHNTRKSARLGGTTQEEVAGRHISTLKQTSPFEKVLATGRAELGVLTLVNGRKCMTDLHPVFWKGKFVGIVSTLLFQSMNRLKNIISTLNEKVGDGNMDIYNAVARIDSNYTFDDFIGQTPVVQELLAHCRNVAKNHVHSILILGESGTGKEILASAFHSANLAQTFKPYVKINCTAIPNDLLESELFGHEKGAFTGAVAAKSGKFELASGGSILLDEIGDMDLRLQSKLLRVLEEGEFEHIGGTHVLPLNARVIASTNHELKEGFANGKFRPDLYYRLSEAEIRIPPLRARPEDIPLLASHLIGKGRIPIRLSPGALDALMRYPWPGNVRELRNVLRWLSFLGEDRDMTAADVLRVMADPRAWGPGAAQPAQCDPERSALLETLEQHQFNFSLAAKHLGISRSTLYNRAKKHGIDIRKGPVQDAPTAFRI
jgi:transcriptional regulator with PAS, ATPase and Fis domain